MFRTGWNPSVIGLMRLQTSIGTEILLDKVLRCYILSGCVITPVFLQGDDGFPARIFAVKNVVKEVNPVNAASHLG